VVIFPSPTGGTIQKTEGDNHGNTEQTENKEQTEHMEREEKK
jgi:hypothetical protein